MVEILGESQRNFNSCLDCHLVNWIEDSDSVEDGL